MREEYPVVEAIDSGNEGGRFGETIIHFWIKRRLFSIFPKIRNPAKSRAFNVERFRTSDPRIILSLYTLSNRASVTGGAARSRMTIYVQRFRDRNRNRLYFNMHNEETN